MIFERSLKETPNTDVDRRRRVGFGYVVVALSRGVLAPSAETADRDHHARIGESIIARSPAQTALKATNVIKGTGWAPAASRIQTSGAEKQVIPATASISERTWIDRR